MWKPLKNPKKLTIKTLQTILVIIPRRIGDVLLATPVIRSLRHAQPDAVIDVVVYKGTEGCIAANRDINTIITIEEKATLGKQLRVICRLLKKYDLSISLLPGDRSVFYAWIAGQYCVGPVENGYKNLWKRLLLDAYVPFDNDDTHTVTMNLSLLRHINTTQINEITLSWTAADAMDVRQILPFCIGSKPYAVIHAHPMFPYKMWTLKGWMELATWLNRVKGFEIVWTGGNSLEEIKYISTIVQSLPVRSTNVAGKLRLGGVAYLLSNATVYVGPDTAVTHMAAASGIPTIALYGPTNPVKWGPMPKDFSLEGKSPYIRKGSQIVKNVFLLQGEGECVPCHQEGCERNIKSLSECLQNIPAEKVIKAVETMLAHTAVTEVSTDPAKNI